VSLSVLAWDHPRATRPLAACSDAWERLTGERFLVTTRSLESFGDDVPRAAGSDLVLIDHPHIGAAAAAGAIIALDELLDDHQLDLLMANSAGASQASYEHGGSHWAVAIDAACQALALALGPASEAAPAPAPTLPAAEVQSAPTFTWDDILALSRAHPGRVALPLTPAHAISALLSMLAASETIAAGSRLASDAALRSATATLAALAGAGPREAFGWEPPEALARLAAGELICVPLVYAYVGYDVRWCHAPALEPGGRPGSILGGVGAAVLSTAADPRGAAQLAAWLGSADVQLELVRSSGGQPAARCAWTAPGGEPMFAAVLPTLEASQMRPRAPWWPEFQRRSGELLASALRDGRHPPVVADELSRLYQHHREVTG
jgi:multiple sugar transport system substrate-binding protein